MDEQRIREIVREELAAANIQIKPQPVVDVEAVVEAVVDALSEKIADALKRCNKQVI